MKRSVAWSFLLPLCAVLVAAGCNKQGPEPRVAQDTEAPAGQPGDGTSAPVAEPPPLPEATPNAVAVGSELGANGAVQAPRPSYGLTDTVYASAPTAGHSPGDTVTVWWTHEDGIADKDESKPLPANADYVNFSFSSADGMRAGAYNVQVDVNGMPVGIADFTVE
ncbi:MAG TPA: hypothetical protein VFM73_01385 [Xanthomonadaceae bacterium]|nr:hypothetical protein [Xanthomonadaceae bacterium]